MCRMTAITKKYIEEMGETGAGISREDEIDVSLNNAFTNKWGEYLLKTFD